MSNKIELGKKYSDERGDIQMILDNTMFHSASLITSQIFSTRASHWHKEDSHYCLVCTGEIWYFERPVGSTERPKKQVFKSGDLFYTPPNTEHEMYFPELTTFLCLSTLPRTSESYESDTTRLERKLKNIYDQP